MIIKVSFWESRNISHLINRIYGKCVAKLITLTKLLRACSVIANFITAQKINVFLGNFCKAFGYAPLRTLRPCAGPLADNFGDCCFASLSSPARGRGGGGVRSRVPSRSCMTSAK